MISHPNPGFTVRKSETKPPSGGPRIRVASFIPKSLRNTPPVREPSTPRTIVRRGRGSDDGLPREDRTTWLVTGSRQRAARRAAVSAHKVIGNGWSNTLEGD